MLDVHAPHEAVHGWRDFFIHILTITIGLLIALGLEASVEALHHHHQVVETREALQRELEENRRRFADDTNFFRHEDQLLREDDAILQSLQKGGGGHTQSVPPIITLKSAYSRMDVAAWKTAQATAVTALMPQSEVQKTSELYSFFERMDQAHEEEADAIAEAYSFLTQHPEAARWTAGQVVVMEELLQHVTARHLRHGFLMQNLAEEYPDFKPAPTREELEGWLPMTVPTK